MLRSGLGQISESREGKVDIEFVSGGRKTILKSTELNQPHPRARISSSQRSGYPNNSVEDAMRTAYKTITPLAGADLQTPTSKLQWEIGE
jgi:hypothetical protein